MTSEFCLEFEELSPFRTKIVDSVVKMPRGRPKRFRSSGTPGSIDCEDIRPKSPSNGPYKCEIETCAKEFPKFAQYRRHKREHDNDKPNRCDKCPASFNVEYNLALHKATHNTDVLKCPDCLKTFSRLASLKSHLMLHEKDESLICSECGDEFSLQIDLDIHLDEHRNERTGEQRVHKCKTCSREFKMIYQLKEHQRTEHKVIKSLSAATHKRRVLDRSGFSHVCTHCGKSFQKPSQLVRHVRVHTGERPYKCNQCERAFNQKGALQIHLSKHTGEKRHTCDLCQALFSQKGNLRAHIARVHEINVTMEQSFPCEECPCVFRKLGSLNAHISKMHGETGPPSMVTLKASLMLAAKGNQNEANAQQQAKEIMPNVDLPDTTLNAVSEVIQQLLELSENSTDTAEAQQQIQRIALGANLTSDILQQALENSGLLGEQQPGSDGITSNTGVPRLAQSVAELLQAQQKQVVIRPRNIGRLHTCRYCNKSFKKPSDLVRHVRIHTHEKPFKCTQCFRAFTVKSTLTAHMKTHTGVKEYKCHVCHKMFATHGSLKVHLRLHTGAKPFECPHCDKKFRTSGHRKTHIASHFKDPNQRKARRIARKQSYRVEMDLPDVPLQEPILITDTGLIQQPPARGASLYNQFVGSGLEQGGTSIDRPYKCQYCAKGFKKSSHLKQHVRSHTGEKPYKCLQCGKCFVSSGVLKSHSRTHTGVKAYKCLICDGTFTTNGSLKRHMSTHSEVRPFMCPYCQKTFKTSVNCKKHMKTHKRELGMQARQQQEAEHGGIPQAEELVEIPVQVQPVETQVTTQVIEAQDTITDQLVEQAQNALLGLQQSQLGQEALAQQAVLAETTLASQAIIQQPLLQIQDATGQDTLTQAALGAQTLTPAQAAALNTQAFGQQVLATLTNNQQNLNQEAQVSLQTQQIQQQLEAITGQNSSLLQQNNFQQLQKDIASLQNRTKEAILRSDGEDGKRTYRCGYCGKAFKKSSHLKQHIRSHTGEKPYTCSQCGRSFVSSGVLKAHQRTHTGVKAFKCNVCEATFTTNGSLTRHMNVHTSTKTFNCSECSEQFKFSLNLKRHLRQHRGEAEENEIEITRRSRQVVKLTDDEAKTLAQSNPPKHATVSEKVLIQSAAEKGRVSEIIDKHKELEKLPKFANQCQHCPKSFKKPSDLLRHIRIHTGEKPYKCDECGKKFTVKSTLDCHMRTHRGSKPINCHVCNTMFATKGSLKVHMRLHTGAKPFKCPHCTEMFRTSGSRKMHIQNVHDKPEDRPRKPSILRSVPKNKIMEEQTTETVELLETVPEEPEEPGPPMTEQDLLQQQQQQQEAQQQQAFTAQQILPITIAGQETLATFPDGATILQGLDGLQLQVTATNLGQNFQIQGLDPSITVQIDPSLLQQLQQGSFNPIMLQASDLNLGNTTVQMAQDASGLAQSTVLTTQPEGTPQTTVQATDSQNLLIQVNENGQYETIVQPQMATLEQTQVQLSETMDVQSTAVTSADQIVTVPFPVVQTQAAPSVEASEVTSVTVAGETSTEVTQAIGAPAMVANPVEIHASTGDVIDNQPTTTQTIAPSETDQVTISQSTLTNSQADNILSQVLGGNGTASEPTLGFATTGTSIPPSAQDPQLNPNLLSLSGDGLISQNLILQQNIGGIVPTSSTPTTSHEASLVTPSSGLVQVTSQHDPDEAAVYNVVDPSLQGGTADMGTTPVTMAVGTGKEGVKITVTEAAASIGSLYQCSEEGCSEVFTQMSLLRQHQSEVHESLRPHVCMICNKGFKRPGHLKEHMNTHVPEGLSTKTAKPTPHKCLHCNKAFAKPSQLERHVRVHTGEKPFQCPKCLKAFNQKNALNIHMSTHTGEKPFKCDVCDQSFSQKGNLKVHIQRTHLQGGSDEAMSAQLQEGMASQDEPIVLPGTSQDSEEPMDFFDEFNA